jgi:hypothetical protein
MDNQNDINIPRPLTFKYSFRIDNIDKEKYDYFEIRRDLSRTLVDHSGIYRQFKNYDKDDYYHNEIFYILNDLFQSRFLFSGNTKAYLTDYSETSGSLIISFTVLIVGTITNYGSIRETIDYFAEDIERVFSTSLNNSLRGGNGGYTVSSTIQEYNNQNSFSQESARPLDTTHYNSLLTKIKVDRVLIGIVFFVLILSLLQNYFSSSDNSKQTDIDEAKVKSIIRDEMRNQKIDELLKTKIDTVYIQKK